MTDIVFKVPDKKSPGFLRRMMAAGRFSELMRKGETGDAYYDNLIQFLLNFVEEPKDRDEAREALLDASEEQYVALLDAVNNQGNPTSAQPSEKS